MVDLRLQEAVNRITPKMNPQIIEGLSVIKPRVIEAWVNDIMLCASESFPPDLKYVGGKRCTPLEQFREITRPLKPNKRFEMTRSDVYLMKYTLRFKGKDLKPFYMFLPYIGQGGLLYLRGTQYKLTPVIGGKVFNIERDNVYMPIPRFRLGFSQGSVSCILNDKVIQCAAVVSYLFNLSKTERSQLRPTILHYILAEFGLQRTLKQFFKVDSLVGKQELDSLSREEWLIYRSRQLPPVIKAVGYQEVSHIRIAIPKAQHSKILDNVIATIFYIIDNSVESTSNVQDLDNPMLWFRLLDKFIFKVTKAEKDRFERMQEHMHGVRMFMDPIVKRILNSDGIMCTTIFELFTYIIIHYQDFIIQYDVGTMFNKELTTVKHLLYHVVHNIFSAMYTLHELPEALLNPDKITNIIQKVISKDRIFTIKGHGELSTASIATDCLLFSTTGNMISYNKAVSVGRSSRSKKPMDDPGMLLHSSQVQVATIQWITKRGPLGRDKINPFVYFSSGTFIAPNPDLAEDDAALRDLLNKRIVLETEDLGEDLLLDDDDYSYED